MERQNPIASMWKTFGNLPLFKQNHLEGNKTKKELKRKSYDWKLDDLDLDLIYGYYHVVGKDASQVLQTPFKNFCIARIGNKYELFQIGRSYRPVVVSFDDHPDIKQWFEQEVSEIN
ncbi:hypothetical protein BKP45_03850 [Anaerobacillus alkalidiazotrophicus]|uniref:Uncharacterized protein n=1 Tax=Anaerobacillus alkalidiazotrophicus TaxID=472963 RepID=A0A1S2MAS3_9BACI|nr:hypothetical protein [Anaerobacillus alkalidiazotrophicus]OIJ21838.1 hypothetical protein BKP45_03850 [Anaerobacillus alkalidiazotrophicus]